MARLLIEGGALSYERTATNAKADRVLTAASLRTGYTGDAGDKQAVLDHIGAYIVSHLVALAAAREESAGTDAALATAAGDRPDWS